MAIYVDGLHLVRDIISSLNGEKISNSNKREENGRGNVRGGSQESGMSQNCNFDISDNDEDTDRAGDDFIRDSRDMTNKQTPTRKMQQSSFHMAMAQLNNDNSIVSDLPRDQYQLPSPKPIPGSFQHRMGQQQSTAAYNDAKTISQGLDMQRFLNT